MGKGIEILHTDQDQTFQDPSSTVDHGGDAKWE